MRDRPAALYQRSEAPDFTPYSGASSFACTRRVPPGLGASADPSDRRAPAHQVRCPSCDRPNPRRGPADDNYRPGGCAAARAPTGCCSGRRAGCAAPRCARRRHPGFVPRTGDPPSRCARRLAPLPARRCARWNNPGASGARGRRCAIARLKRSDYRIPPIPGAPTRSLSVPGSGARGWRNCARPGVDPVSASDLSTARLGNKGPSAVPGRACSSMQR